MAVTTFLSGLLAVGVGTAADPSTIMLDVGLVRVSPFRPGTQTPWDPVAEKPQKDNCESVGWFAAAVGLMAAYGHPMGAAAGKAGAEDICHAVVGASQASKAPTPSDPDLFVRLVASRDVAYRSYTAHNTTSHVFHFRVAVPVDAIPTPGLQLYVQNDRGVGPDDSHEVIGSVRLRRKDLLAAVGGDGVLRLDDKSGGLDRIEIEVTNVELPKTFEGRGDLSKFALFRLEGIDLPAGVVADVNEGGTYQIGQLGAFTPVGRGTSPMNFQAPAFRNAPHGAGIAVVGESGHVAGYLVRPCALFVVTTPGEILMGVNARDRRLGSVGMQVQSRFASVEEWRTGKAKGKCKAPGQSAAATENPAELPPPSDAAEGPGPPPADAPANWSGPVVAAVQRLVQSNGSNIALSIQRILHPTGSSAVLRAFDYSPGPDGVRFRFATSWRGALGAEHVTTVVWEIGPQGHRRAVLLSDTAPIRAGRRNLQELNSYFVAKLYPMVAQSAGSTF